MCQHLLEGKPALGRMGTLAQRVEINSWGRSMQQHQRIRQRQLAKVGQVLVFKQFRDASLAEAQGLIGQVTPAPLADTLGGGINRRQRGFNACFLPVFQKTVLGMHHLQAGRSGPDFTVTLDKAVTAQAPGLALAEVKLAHRDPAGVVRDHGHQAAPAPITNAAGLDPADNQRFGARAQFTNGSESGSVLIAQRQMKKHIGNVHDAKTPKLFCELRADALKDTYRLLYSRIHLVVCGAGKTNRTGVRRPPPQWAHPWAGRQQQRSPAKETAHRSTPPSPR